MNLLLFLSDSGHGYAYEKVTVINVNIIVHYRSVEHALDIKSSVWDLQFACALHDAEPKTFGLH